MSTNTSSVVRKISEKSSPRLIVTFGLAFFALELLVASVVRGVLGDAYPLASMFVRSGLSAVALSALSYWLAISPVARLLAERTERERDCGEERRKFEERIQKLQEEKKQWVEISTLVHGLKETSESIHKALCRLLDLANTPSSGMEKTSASLQDFTVTLEELAKSAKQIANLAADIAHISQKSHQIAQEAAKTLQFSQEALQNIQKSSNSITQRILDLNEKSREIGTILDIIGTVVDKTDILALNAALEGTKAGEAGKGFSVVAKEMRRLSERVAESTTKIKDVIRDIQTAISSSVIATEDGVKTTISGIQVVEKTAREFASIFQMVESIKDASSQISLAIQQQTSATEQSVGSMNEISDVVRQNTAGVRNLAVGLADLNGVVRHFKEQADRLCDLAPIQAKE